MFELGKILLTSGANANLENIEVLQMLDRYIRMDWGELGKEDSKCNDLAVKNNDDRILAKYIVNDKSYYVITEYDRSYTTIMLTEEY